MQTITWPQLVVLMAYGDGNEDSIAGDVRFRSVTVVEDWMDDDGARVEEHPVLGRVRVDEGHARVCRRGSSVRREQDGRLLSIAGQYTFWVWLDGAEVPTAFPRGTTSWGFGDHAVVERRPASRWEGSDFTTVTGPIEARTFLGRDAWAFELAPPPHKPYPLQMVVDAQTGLVLHEGNADFGSYTEWTSLEVGVDLPDHLFTWDGPVLAPPDRRAEHEQHMALRREWLVARGIVAPAIAIDPELHAHEWDDDSGSFFASFDVALHGCLARRPSSDDPWPVVESTTYEHTYRWRDGPWQWFLAAIRPLDDATLALIQERLRGTT